MYNVISRSYGNAIAVVATYPTWSEATLADLDKHRFEHADTDVTALTVDQYNSRIERDRRQQHAYDAWVSQGCLAD